MSFFPSRWPPVHEVWSWSLGGQGVIMTGVRMFRTPVSILWTTFAKHLALLSPICHFPHQDDHCPWSLELESWRTGGHPETPRTLFYTLGDFNWIMSIPRTCVIGFQWLGWVVLTKKGSTKVLLALTLVFWTPDSGLTKNKSEQLTRTFEVFGNC